MTKTSPTARAFADWREAEDNVVAAQKDVSTRLMTLDTSPAPWRLQQLESLRARASVLLQRFLDENTLQARSLRWPPPPG